MKLYATTTSERATKGQGGNSFLIIDIYIKDKNSPMYKMSIFPNRIELENAKNNELVFSQDIQDGKILSHDKAYPNGVIIEQKAKKQKGAICEKCGYLSDHIIDGELCRHYQNE